jgi:hypothetical protein
MTVHSGSWPMRVHEVHHQTQRVLVVVRDKGERHGPGKRRAGCGEAFEGGLPADAEPVADVGPRPAGRAGPHDVVEPWVVNPRVAADRLRLRKPGR